MSKVRNLERNCNMSIIARLKRIRRIVYFVLFFSLIGAIYFGFKESVDAYILRNLSFVESSIQELIGWEENEDEDSKHIEVNSKEVKLTNSHEAVSNETNKVEEEENAQVIPLTTEILLPSDIVAIKGDELEIEAYIDGAISYIWEVYNYNLKDYVALTSDIECEIGNRIDELNRKVSYISAKADIDRLIRVTIIIPGEEDIVSELNIRVLEEEIISIDIKDKTVMEAGKYISTLNIPLIITYESKDSEEITGLNGLSYYAPKSEEIFITKDDSTCETIETVTTISEEHLYRYIEYGANEVGLIYRNSGGKVLQIYEIIEGIDEVEPVIESVDIGENIVSKTSLSVPVDIEITVTAKDNISNIEELSYACVPSKSDIADNTWVHTSDIVCKALKNGAYDVCVKDKAGNVSRRQIEIIVVDQKKPIIEDVELENDGIIKVKSNVIIVSANDKSEIEYSYRLGDMDSGWISDNRYVVDSNGKWIIYVRDKAGNESSFGIEINNIDNTPPVITYSFAGESIGSDSKLDDKINVSVINKDINDGKQIEITSNTMNEEKIIGDVNSVISEYNPISITKNNASQSLAQPSYNLPQRGDRGEQGMQGIRGENGTTYYTYIRYATDSNGSNIAMHPNSNTNYLGVYVGTEIFAPQETNKYTWSKFVGDNSYTHIAYAIDDKGTNMTSSPNTDSDYIGFYSGSSVIAPQEASMYVWSMYKDNKLIKSLDENNKELEAKIKLLEEKLDKLTTP